MATNCNLYLHCSITQLFMNMNINLISNANSNKRETLRHSHGCSPLFPFNSNMKTFRYIHGWSPLLAFLSIIFCGFPTKYRQVFYMEILPSTFRHSHSWVVSNVSSLINHVLCHIAKTWKFGIEDLFLD